MSAMKNWKKLPTRWIEDRGLVKLRWRAGEGSSNIAALMLLAVIGHNFEEDTFCSHVTYDTFAVATGLSRTKISHGLMVLEEQEIIDRLEDRQSTYQLIDFNPAAGWGKLPARSLYHNGMILAFHEFHLRKKVELDALKLYFAIIARRDNNSNLARMNYDTIETYTGIPRNRIKSAISLLAANSLIHVEHIASTISDFGVSNAYRLVHLDQRRHMGTTGKLFVNDQIFND